MEDGVEDGRHGQDAGHLVALDRLHERHGVELAQHDVLAADHGQEVGRAPTVDVEERDNVQGNVVLGELQPDLRVQAVQVQLPVGHRHALGEAGRAAGVEQLGDLVLVDLRCEGVGRAAGQKGFVLIRGDAVGGAFHDHETWLSRQLRDYGFDDRLEILVEEDDLRACMADDVGDLLWRQADVDRVEHRPGLEHAVVGLEQLMGVVGDEADPLVRRYAQITQGVGEPVGPLTELAVGESLVAVDDADFLPEVRLRAVAELEHRKGYEHRRPPPPVSRGVARPRSTLAPRDRENDSATGSGASGADAGCTAGAGSGSGLGIVLAGGADEGFPQALELVGRGLGPFRVTLDGDDPAVVATFQGLDQASCLTGRPTHGPQACSKAGVVDGLVVVGVDDQLDSVVVLVGGCQAFGRPLGKRAR